MKDQLARILDQYVKVLWYVSIAYLVVGGMLLSLAHNVYGMIFILMSIWGGVESAMYGGLIKRTFTNGSSAAPLVQRMETGRTIHLVVLIVGIGLCLWSIYQNPSIKEIGIPISICASTYLILTLKFHWETSLLMERSNHNGD